MNGLSGALSPTVSGHDGALFLSIWGTWTIINTPVDALPDLSDVQVIIKTSYPGGPADCRKPVTYPLTTTMLSVHGAKPCVVFTVR